MTMSDRFRRSSARAASGSAVAVAVCAALAAPATAGAQTTSGRDSGRIVPYQASQRHEIGSGLGQSDLPRGGVFQPRVEAAVQYASNVNLAEDSSDELGMAGLELAPGFYASYASATALAVIDYSLIGRVWEESDYNDVSNRLSANGQWDFVPEWLSLRGDASYTDGIVDPRAGLNYGGLGIFGSSNLNEVATASISPVFRHRFNDLEVAAQYRYGRTWYLDEGKGQPTVGFTYNQDSVDQSANVSAGTAADTGSRLSASVFYDWQKSEYDVALPFQYERAGIDLGYRIGRTLTVVGDAGLESDLDESSTAGGLDSDFWSAGLRWDPNDRTSAEGRYGQRFFGDSWSLSASHRARLLEFDASYSEEPTVETRTLSLGEFNPGELPGWFPGDEFGRFNSAPFIARNAAAGVRAIGSRTRVGLRGYQQERDYLSARLRDETTLGVTFNAVRDLASNLSADFELSYYDRDYAFDQDVTDEQFDSTYQDVQAIFRLIRSTGERLTLTGEAGYFTRDADSVAGNDYDGWWIGLRARWIP
jgi:hypothetical protein